MAIEPEIVLKYNPRFFSFCNNKNDLQSCKYKYIIGENTVKGSEKEKENA